MNREILASCTFTVISTVLSALQSPPLSINLYVMFVTNSLLVSVSSHVNENVTPAVQRSASWLNRADDRPRALHGAHRRQGRAELI